MTATSLRQTAILLELAAIRSLLKALLAYRINDANADELIDAAWAEAAHAAGNTDDLLEHNGMGTEE